MSNMRFVLAAAALFGFAFGGVFFGLPWASKGFPVLAMRAAPPQPDARVPAFDGLEQGVRQDDENSKIENSKIESSKIESSKTPKSDSDAGRNRMRLTAIETADAYARSPCDQAIRAAFIVSASTYLRATIGKDVWDSTFATPMDMRVREAIGTAFGAGGIAKDEFPADVERWAARTGAPQGPVNPCSNSAALLQRSTPP